MCTCMLYIKMLLFKQFATCSISSLVKVRLWWYATTTSCEHDVGEQIWVIGWGAKPYRELQVHACLLIYCLWNVCRRCISWTCWDCRSITCTNPLFASLIIIQSLHVVHWQVFLLTPFTMTTPSLWSPFACENNYNCACISVHLTTGLSSRNRLRMRLKQVLPIDINNLTIMYQSMTSILHVILVWQLLVHMV